MDTGRLGRAKVTRSQGPNVVLVKNADSQAYPRPTASLDVGPRGSPGPSLTRVAFTSSFLLRASFVQHTSTQTGLFCHFPTSIHLTETSLLASVRLHHVSEVK